MTPIGQQPTGQPPRLSFNGSINDNNSDSLASNNPFRNFRATSPGHLDTSFPTTPTSPFDDPMPPSRPLSRNPFLDQPLAPRPADVAAAAKTQSLTAEDIFGSLTLDDSPAFSAKQPVDSQLLKKRPTDRPAPPRRESESQASSRAAADKHRPNRSQEETLRARKPPPPSSKPTTRPSLLDDSPPRKPVQRRPRRNSDSSVMDFDSKSLTAEEKRMIEAKRRERTKGKSTRPSRKMDIIDQLDATSIYGTGLFHHDGPFDALNPHRNRQNSKKLSPMQAFPEGSLNNTLGGSGPLNAQADHSTFMGHGGDEAFQDFAASGKTKSSREPVIFDAQARTALVHGDESHGLGTSTFLEGTPAARSAIVRRQAEHAQEVAEGGLQRKKSVAQRIRQRVRPDYSSRPMPGHGRYDSDDFGEESITVPRPPPREREGRLSPPPMPRRGSGSAIERRTSADDVRSPSNDAPAKPSGLLGRMKSLKGGRRPTRNAEAGGMAT
ncbi:Pal1 cell morphology domain-containing protein [Trichoderma barbatum]